ncbi:DinB family protein, partial [Frankia sp. AiPs1]|uniref:DinB family protein n=1 Tax=Frankia sp. AiPs1 TaxID=573493 RepID=UPI002042FECF
MRIGRLTQDPGPSTAPITAQAVADALDLARARSLAYTDVDAEELLRQHSPLMSPLVWDLAHIGNYEDLWLVRALGDAATRPGLDDVYDAFRHSRASRIRLALLGPAETRGYLREVRGRTLDALDRLAPLPADAGETDAPPVPGADGLGAP